MLPADFDPGGGAVEEQAAQFLLAFGVQDASAAGGRGADGRKLLRTQGHVGNGQDVIPAVQDDVVGQAHREIQTDLGTDTGGGSGSPLVTIPAG